MTTKQNYQKAFAKGAKGRTNFLVFALLTVAVGGAAVLFSKSGNNPGHDAAAIVQAAPETVGRDTSVDKASEAYIQTLRQSNQQETDKALANGNSMVATLTNKAVKVEDEATQAAKAPVVVKEVEDPAKALSRYEPPPFVPPQGGSVNMAGSAQNGYGQPGFNQAGNQQAQVALTNQVNELLSSWTAPGQEVVTVRSAAPANGASPAKAVAAQSAGTAPAASADDGSETLALIPAGTIQSAVILNEVVSTDQGPVIAKVVAGPYNGATLIGTARQNDEKLVVQFNSMSFKNKTAGINAYAIDPTSSRTALADDVNRQWFRKYGTVFLASLVGGYGEAMAQAGQTVTMNGSSTMVTQERMSTSRAAQVALGKSGSTLAQQLAGEAAQIRTVVTIYQGAPIGVLYVADLMAKK